MGDLQRRLVEGDIARRVFLEAGLDYKTALEEADRIADRVTYDELGYAHVDGKPGVANAARRRLAELGRGPGVMTAERLAELKREVAGPKRRPGPPPDRDPSRVTEGEYGARWQQEDPEGYRAAMKAHRDKLLKREQERARQ